MLDALRRWLRPTPPVFDPAWDAVLSRDFAQWNEFDETELARLRSLIARFVHETDWEAARGMHLTDEVSVTISAHACVLLLGLDIDE